MVGRIVLVLIALLTVFSCDLEKFLGYQYEVDPLPEFATISGKIKNRFTGAPVTEAIIRFGEQETTTDSSGYYQLNYIFNEDDLRNRPVTVSIEAYNYYSLNTEEIVFPENRLNYQLDYAAPIVKRVALIGHICQAEILDYQGAQDIQRVRGSFFYALPGVPMWTLNLRPELDKALIDSPLTAYFQVRLPQDMPNHLVLGPSCVIHAWDQSAFHDSSSNSLVGVDTFIFDPALVPLIQTEP